MPELNSSAIEHVDHDGHALVITFKGGREYRYPSAGSEHVDGMGGADSAGRYFNEHIRGKHDHEVRHG